MLDITLLLSVEVDDVTGEVRIFSNYDKESIVLADVGALEDLHGLIGSILSQGQAAAANGKEADHA
jgi:hypothetical protein